jgi:hypothetical protein
VFDGFVQPNSCISYVHVGFIVHLCSRSVVHKSTPLMSHSLEGVDESRFLHYWVLNFFHRPVF